MCGPYASARRRNQESRGGIPSVNSSGGTAMLRFAIPLAATLFLVACETARGFGQDVDNTVDAVTRAASE